jgi:hypothetical protein
MLIDRDYEIKQILADLCITESYNYLFVKLDYSSSDYAIVYGSNNANLYDYAYMIYEKSVICDICKQVKRYSETEPQYSFKTRLDNSEFMGNLCNKCSLSIEEGLRELGARA